MPYMPESNTNPKKFYVIDSRTRNALVTAIHYLLKHGVVVNNDELSMHCKVCGKHSTSDGLSVILSHERDCPVSLVNYILEDLEL